MLHQLIEILKQFGDAFKSLNDDITSNEDAYEAYLYTVINGSQEQLDYISSIRADLETLKDTYDKFNTLTSQGPFDINIAGQTLQVGGAGGLTKEDIATQIENLTKQGGALLNSNYQQSQLGQLQVPGIVGDVSQPKTTQQLREDEIKS